MPPNFHADTPLAQRMRPTTLDAIIGQEHLLAAGAPLRRWSNKGICHRLFCMVKLASAKRLLPCCWLMLLADLFMPCLP